ncbi:MAG: serine/threonine protein kinase [Myxococcaceae bacterium]
MTSQQPSSRLRPFRPLPFGRYTLLFPLSTGGMGEIYLARLEGAQGFEKLCVIKKILPHLSSDPDFVERFGNEAKTLVKLSHGSIAQVLDMGMEGGDPFLALEYVDGKDLRKVAARMRDRNQPMPLTFVLYVMSRVLDALAYAHRKRDDEEKEIGLVHRDVSPQNILISYEGEVKVIDFGLAKSTLNAAKTNPSIILGKFLYMSPEQARHQKVDRRSDLYSVGLCLYELIAGKNPFDEVAPGELMAKVATPTIAPLQSIEPLCPSNVAAVVMKALEVDSARRFQNAEEFRGKLLACLLEIDASAGPESVTRFMREAFSTEYTQERKLLAALREQMKSATTVTLSSQAPVKAKEVDTAVFNLRDVAPSQQAASSLSDAAPGPSGKHPSGPIQPTALSFAPTPRSNEGAEPSMEGETMPGIVVDLDTNPGKRPGVPALPAPPLGPPPKSVAGVAAPKPAAGKVPVPAPGASGLRPALNPSAVTYTPGGTGSRPALGTTSGVHGRPAQAGQAGPGKPPPGVPRGTSPGAPRPTLPGYEPAVVVQDGLEWSPPSGASAQTPVGDPSLLTRDNPASTLDEPDAVTPGYRGPPAPIPAGSQPYVIIGTLLPEPTGEGGAAAGEAAPPGEGDEAMGPTPSLELARTRPSAASRGRGAAGMPEPPEVVVTQNVPRRRSVWVLVLPVLLLTLVVAGYFIYDLGRTGALSFGPAPVVPQGPPSLGGPKPRTGGDTAINPNAPRGEALPVVPVVPVVVDEVAVAKEAAPAVVVVTAVPAAPQPEADAGAPVALVEPAEDDLLAGLKKPKKAVVTKRQPDSPAAAAFKKAKAARNKLKGRWSCDAGGTVSLLCFRFDSLEATFEDLANRSGGDDAVFIRQASQLTADIQVQLKKKEP